MNARGSASASVEAPCKINPTLVVIERRPDGFHELELSYLALDLADRVRVSACRGRASELCLDGPMSSEDIPRDARNLARAAVDCARELARAHRPASEVVDFDLELTKRIPAQAGLGGGSSDAAAAMLGVSALLGLAASDPRLLPALAALGSDCAFFLAARESGHARGRGRGERIEVLPALRSGWWVALVAPRARAPTETVYRTLGELGDPAAARARALRVARAWSQATTLAALRAALVNDLESAALRAIPELSSWRSLLDESGAEHFRLAGSGSSFFGFYSSEGDARDAVEKIRGAAALRGLGLRGSWVAQPAGHGVRRID